ncbi:MAG: N-acetylneuraminate synthase family protein [bacterium]
MRQVMDIEGVKVGSGERCFIIGEIGSNHNSDKQVVKDLIDAAAEAHFDAIKFQLYDAEEAFSKNVSTTDVKLDHLYGVCPWWEIARDKILMPRDWFGEMFEYARSKKLIPFSTVHRKPDVDFLLQYGLPLLKIASIDLHYHFLLRQLAQYKKPMIISTGMAYLSEIDETMRMLRNEQCDEIILLHCVSCYPPRPQDLNLKNIISLHDAFGVPVGFSDHSSGIVSAIAAVTLGAVVIEKHITIDKSAHGPDHPFALEPQEMIQLVNAVREVEESLGSTQRRLSPSEMDAREMIRRSIVTKASIKKGERITYEKIKFARPGTGISTNEFKYIEGRRVNRDILEEEIIRWDMVER